MGAASRRRHGNHARARGAVTGCKWFNTTIGNIKDSIRGTYHSIKPKHVPHYLAQFEYRFKRRYRLEDIITRLTPITLRAAPKEQSR